MAEKLLRANKGYTLFSLRTGEVVARLRTIGQDDRVQVLWCCHDAWGNQVSF